MANNVNHRALLPAGIGDLLPPEAAHEAQVLEQIMGILDSFGYERIKPPLIEFEDSLTDGLGAAVTHQTFRLMDPISQKMMGVRADMTPQAARIAQTRLINSPRPLRLSYAGQVVRVRGSQLRPERQFTQVGAELIGAPSPAGDAEIIAVAAQALQTLGIENLSIDLGMPTLVPAICPTASENSPTGRRLRAALDRKDVAAVRDLETEIGKPVASILAAMLAVSGNAHNTLEHLSELDLGEAGARQCATLADTLNAVSQRVPDLNLTVDPVENRGFEYHTGVTFTFFACGVRGELGRGGRYHSATEANKDQAATGFSLFMDTVLRAIGAPQTVSRVFLPAALGFDAAQALRNEGWIVVEGLTARDDDMTEAQRMNCTHLATAEGVRELQIQNGDT